MGTCDSGPGQRDQLSADCYAQCREVTMLAPVAVTTRWCSRCPGLFHQIPAPSSTPRKRLCHSHAPPDVEGPMPSEGEECIQAGSPPHTHHPANLLEPASRCHASSLPSSFPRVSLRVAAQAGYFRHTLDRIFTINIPESLIFPSTIIVHLGFIINSEMMQSLYDWGEHTKRFGTNKTTT